MSQTKTTLHLFGCLLIVILMTFIIIQPALAQFYRVEGFDGEIRHQSTAFEYEDDNQVTIIYRKSGELSPIKVTYQKHAVIITEVEEGTELDPTNIPKIDSENLTNDLVSAVHYKNIPEIRKAINHGASPYAVNQYNFSALDYLFKNAYADIMNGDPVREPVSLNIEKEVAPYWNTLFSIPVSKYQRCHKDQKWNVHYTVKEMARAKKFENIRDYLAKELDKGFDINCTYNATGNLWLMEKHKYEVEPTNVLNDVIKEGADFETVRFMLDHGADVNTVPVLYTALELGDFQIIYELIKEGADATRRNYYYQTSLEKLAMVKLQGSLDLGVGGDNKMYAVAKLLIEVGADPYLESYDGSSFGDGYAFGAEIEDNHQNNTYKKIMRDYDSGVIKKIGVENLDPDYYASFISE